MRLFDLLLSILRRISNTSECIDIQCTYYSTVFSWSDKIRDTEQPIITHNKGLYPLRLVSYSSKQGLSVTSGRNDLILGKCAEISDHNLRAGGDEDNVDVIVVDQGCGHTVLSRWSSGVS